MRRVTAATRYCLAPGLSLSSESALCAVPPQRLTGGGGGGGGGGRRASSRRVRARRSARSARRVRSATQVRAARASTAPSTRSSRRRAAASATNARRSPSTHSPAKPDPALPVPPAPESALRQKAASLVCRCASPLPSAPLPSPLLSPLLIVPCSSHCGGVGVGCALQGTFSSKSVSATCDACPTGRVAPSAGQSFCTVCAAVNATPHHFSPSPVRFAHNPLFACDCVCVGYICHRSGRHVHALHSGITLALSRFARASLRSCAAHAL